MSEIEQPIRTAEHQVVMQKQVSELEQLNSKSSMSTDEIRKLRAQSLAIAETAIAFSKECDRIAPNDIRRVPE